MAKPKHMMNHNSFSVHAMIVAGSYVRDINWQLTAYNFKILLLASSYLHLIDNNRTGADTTAHVRVITYSDYASKNIL